ncbi:MAG: hypothetical protein ACYTJ0_03965, partial [Planctomycetota bacterium]
GPYDYRTDAIFHPETRAIMDKITFEHGGPEYDKRYPEGIPTSLQIVRDDGRVFDSELVMFPAGHARNTTSSLVDILQTKFDLLGTLAVAEPAALIESCTNLASLTPEQLRNLYDFEILDRGVL